MLMGILLAELEIIPEHDTREALFLCEVHDLTQEQFGE